MLPPVRKGSDATYCGRMTSLEEAAAAATTPTGARADRSRRAIIEAARQAFLREGFQVSVDAIAAEAGVSKVTVYNHFRNKEILFTAVVGDALDKALGDTFDEVGRVLSEASDVRTTLLRTARVWVAAVAVPEVIALRNLVTGELGRFPELGAAWNDRGPGRFYPLVGELVTKLRDRGELVVPDVDVAVIQLFSLTLYPHLVFGSFGSSIDGETADKLIVSGVDMFLGQYGTHDG
jgi:AcrR family transcriptional regulator